MRRSRSRGRLSRRHPHRHPHLRGAATKNKYHLLPARLWVAAAAFSSQRLRHRGVRRCALRGPWSHPLRCPRFTGQLCCAKRNKSAARWKRSSSRCDRKPWEPAAFATRRARGVFGVAAAAAANADALAGKSARMSSTSHARSASAPTWRRNAERRVVSRATCRPRRRGAKPEQQRQSSKAMAAVDAALVAASSGRREAILHGQRSDGSCCPSALIATACL